MLVWTYLKSIICADNQHWPVTHSHWTSNYNMSFIWIESEQSCRIWMDKQPQPLFPERRRALMLFDSSTDSLPQHSFTREKPDMWKSITTPPIPINTSFIPLHVLILNPSCLSLLSSTIVTFSTCWVHHHTLPSYLLLVSILQKGLTATASHLPYLTLSSLLRFGTG